MKLNLTADIFAINAAGPDGEPRRTVEGVAAPYNTVATVSDGTRVMLLPGSLPVDGASPKFIRDHDLSKPIGIVSERISTDEAMLFTAKISATREGDEALTLAADGVLDSVSVGVEPTDYTFSEINGETVLVVKRAEWRELSLLPFGAFPTAKVASVAAAEPEPETTPDTNSEEESQVEATPTPVDTVEASIPTQPLFAAPARQFTMPGAGEYIAKFLKGGAEFAEFNARIRAAAPNVETTDVPGILPEPIVGAVYNNFRGLRPVIDSIGARAMPAGGKIFRRPSVTTNTTIGASNGENTALDQGTFVVTDNTVTKQWYGGYVRLSEEAMDETDPAVLGLLIDDMARVYANQTDDYAADQLTSGVTNTNNFTAANIADPTDWVQWMYTAASDILTASNGWLPTTLWLAPNRWASLGQLEDTSGRPLFPQVGPMNAYGAASPAAPTANAFGMNVVVDRNLASGTMIIGDPTGFEIFEQPKGAISVEAADGSLSRYIKFRGVIACLMIDSTKFIKAAFV